MRRRWCEPALGLKQRILARPLGGRPLGHQSGRKAGSVLVRPRGRLFQKPCLRASEGLGGSHDKWLRKHLGPFELSAGFFL